MLLYPGAGMKVSLYASRVAYTLREAFELPYRQIGTLLGITEAHTRQLVNRARRLPGPHVPPPYHPIP